MEEQFERFLKEHDVFHKFWNNTYGDFADEMHTMRPVMWICNAFEWDKTEEREHFWDCVHEDWINRLNEIEEEQSGIQYSFPQYSKTAFLSHYLHRGDKIYLSEVLNDSTLPKTAVVDELIHGNGYVEVYLR